MAVITVVKPTDIDIIRHQAVTGRCSGIEPLFRAIYIRRVAHTEPKQKVEWKKEGF